LRDLPSLYGINDVQELNYLFTTLAFNTANEISLQELAKNSGVAKNTIKRYIEYLEAAFLVKVVHRVDHSGRRFDRANFFKVYLTNPSMRAALFSPVNGEDESMGRLAETAIFSQWFHSDIQLNYARWDRGTDKGEVDIVYLAPGGKRVLWAVEVKWSDRFPSEPNKLHSLMGFCRKNGLNCSRVTSKTVTLNVPDQGITFEFVPAALYCYTVGHNLILNKETIKTILSATQKSSDSDDH
jgi:predicted AAA+ superfamily ATPase